MEEVGAGGEKEGRREEEEREEDEKEESHAALRMDCEGVDCERKEGMEGREDAGSGGQGFAETLRFSAAEEEEGGGAKRGAEVEPSLAEDEDEEGADS